MANWLSALSRTRKLFAATFSTLWSGGAPEGVTLDELEENLLRAELVDDGGDRIAVLGLGGAQGFADFGAQGKRTADDGLLCHRARH